MPDQPRIDRAAAEGRIIRPGQPLPVIATIRWHHGVVQEVPAIAVAWTTQAVEIQWEMERGQGLRTDWVPACDIRRGGDKSRSVKPPSPLQVGAASKQCD